MTKRKNSSNHWRTLANRHPSAFLLAAQLFSLLLYVMFDGSTGGRVLLNAVGILILILVVWVITHSPYIRWIAWVLVVPAITLSLLSMVFTNPTLTIWSSLLEAGLYFYAVGSLVLYMMRDDRVTADELFAAGGTFTLLAWGFAYLYLACQTMIPGSIAGSINPGQPRTFIELLSLSFTNLTATGLGDVMPILPLARVLVMLEQFTGIAYVAVVVSRLIGMTIVRAEDKRSRRS